MDAKDEARESNALFRARQVKEVNRLNDRIAKLEAKLARVGELHTTDKDIAPREYMAEMDSILADTRKPIAVETGYAQVLLDAPIGPGSTWWETNKEITVIVLPKGVE